MGRGGFRLYLVLAVIGAAVPLAAFAPWAMAHGVDAGGFIAALFVNRVSAFFGLDVIVSAIVLLCFVWTERSVAGRWWAVLATVTIGVSCGLPLFLALRARSGKGME